MLVKGAPDVIFDIGNICRIRLSVSTVNQTYELSGITHVTPFHEYGKHSTGPSTYGPWVRTYSKLFSCKSVLRFVYRAQTNEIYTYGRVSRGSLPRVRRYGLLYLRTVEYDQSHTFLSCDSKHGRTPFTYLLKSIWWRESPASAYSKRRYKLTEHDDVIKWKPFSRYWPFVQGIHRSPVNSPHKGQWRGALMFSFDLRLNMIE